MWTLISEVFTSDDLQNGWAYFVATSSWHKVLPKSPDGVTNVFMVLCAAHANNRQAYVVLDGSGNITQVYM